MGVEDSDKIIRIPGDTLCVNISQEEINYRTKYLPDPANLTDEKLVCTVCSVPLAQNIHKGKDIFVHRALHVLVCENCYLFYGDGCFSVDEDGDDKYCRWCGQGGTLYLCSTCTCAFCQKCVKQNLKPSVLADLENDDWKCYICNPRPLFGCRTICWGAEELNKIGKEKDKEKLRKQRERLEKIEEEKKKKEESRKSLKHCSSEEEVLPKKRTRGKNSDSSSPEVMPTKRPKRDSKVAAGDRLNGRTRRNRNDSSSDDMFEDEKRPSRTSRSKVNRSKKSAESSSDESDVKKKSRIRKKKQKESSDDSSEEDKKKTRRKSHKKKADSSDDDTDDEKKVKRKKVPMKKKPASDSSTDEKEKKKNKKKKKDSSDDESDGDVKKKKKTSKKKDSDDGDSDDSNSKRKKSFKNKNDLKQKSEAQDSDIEPKKGKKATDTDDEIKPKLSSKDLAENAMIKKRIKLAILWLNNTVKDIAELGGLISLRATKFCKKKINLDSLKSYEDVINTVSKLKQLMSGIHSNYDHIEKTLDGHLKPWKILTGMEEQENDKNLEAEMPNVKEEDISKPDLDGKSEYEGIEKSQNDISDCKSSNGKVEKKKAVNDDDNNMNLHWSGMSADDSDTEEKKATRALISKADETLTKDEKECNKSINDGNNINKEDTEVKNKPQEKEKLTVLPAKISSKQEPDKTTEEKSEKEDTNESCKDDTDNDAQSSGEKSNNESDEELPTKKKTSPLKLSSNKKDEENSEEEKLLSEKNNSSLISSRESPKKKYDSSDKRRIRRHAVKLKPSSSQESISELTVLTQKIKERWMNKDSTEMNLKTLPGLDSSDDHDSNSEVVNDENSKRDLKKKSEASSKRSKKTKRSKLDKGKHSDIPKKEKKGLSSSEDETVNDNIEQNVKKPKDSKSKKSKKPKSEKASEDESRCSDDNQTHESKTKPGNNVELDGGKKDFDLKKKNNTLDSEEEEIGEQEFNVTIENEMDDEENMFKDEDSIMNVDGENVAQEVTIEDSPPTNKTKLVSLDSSEDEAKNRKAKNKLKAKEKRLKKKSERNQNRIKAHSLLESSDDDSDDKKLTQDDEEKSVQSVDDEEDPKEKTDCLMLLSSSDSSDSDMKLKKRKKKTSSNSDFTSGSEEEENKPKKKRKLIRCKNSSAESGGSGDEEDDINKKSATGESPGKGGRKNIKKIKGKGDLEDATLEAAEEEKERRKRIEERQKLFNQIFEVKEVKKLDKLVLDFDPVEKKELISVHKDLVEKMKPHQAKGVKFMWDSCFESMKRLKKEKGSGCILAHCMGLGKTFQVISLVHTVLTHEDTGVRTVMVVCPLSTVLNWVNEFGKWLDGVEGSDDIEVFHLTKCKQNPERARELRRWQHNGGVLIIGYEMFRNLACETTKKFKAKMKKDFKETLIEPGADLIVCDEGHMLKNEATALSKAMTKVKTLRRVVLTGTPLQNNLKEYHCMVQFVKPSLLGTRKEFLNRFVNPITNGQFVDSTDKDVKIMKRRAHVLHKMLEGLVQRFDYNVLTPFLPPKHEYVISVCLSELQVKLYQYYLENFSQKSDGTKAGSRLFMDWQALGRVWTHPRVLKMSTDKENLMREKRALEESDSEGSIKDFIDDGSDAETTPEESSDDNSSNASIKSGGAGKRKVTRSGRVTRSTRASAKNYAHLESSDEEKEKEAVGEEEVDDGVTKGAWWSDMVDAKQLDDITLSGKLVLLFAILKECEMIEDKVLVFSQSLYSLNLIEYFLSKIDEATQAGRVEESLGNHQGSWSKGLDYFRLDGSTSSENRNIWCKSFNRPDNERARLFLISTRAGGLGINLTAANRVIIFDASWNPSHDIQSIFRIYRFGQNKPCYVYRFIAHGTMEEKVYDRQVAKQSLSNRVVDEQQVHRHFSMNDLNELYTFTPPTKKEDRPTPSLPKDPLMAEILTQFNDWIEKYHEHDSLLENVVEEELNEEERKLAWEDYENDKKGLIPPPANTGGLVNNSVMSYQIEYLRQTLKAKYPTKSDEELNQILIYQVSLLMKQQQMFQNQASGSMPRPPTMYENRNMTPEQMYSLQQHQMQMQYMQQQMQMKQAMQNPTVLPKQSPLDFQKQMMLQRQTNLARLQMQQLQQQQKQQKQQMVDPQSYLQNLLSSQPSMQVTPAAAQLQKMKENYDASRLNNALTITEIKDDNSNVK